MMPRRPWNATLGLSLAAVTLALAFALVSLASLIVAAVRPEPAAPRTADRMVSAIQRHADCAEQSQRQFNGRSAFFRPIVIDKTQRDKPKDIGEPATTQPTAIVHSCPERYTGPTMIGFVGDEVWFKSRTANEAVMKLAVGSSDANLSVLCTNLPWSARVSLDGCTYDLSLWKRDYEEYLDLPAKNGDGDLLKAQEAFP